MTIRNEIVRLMKVNGYICVRSKGGHKVWKNDKIGSRIVTASTPSCPRVMKNIKRDIRNARCV